MVEIIFLLSLSLLFRNKIKDFQTEALDKNMIYLGKVN